MPTRTHSTGPFAPRGPLAREQLTAYAEGLLTPAERREVEGHLENDALSCDAAEGLQQSGASSALKDLDRMRPSGTGTHIGFARITAALLAGAFVAVTVWYLLPEKTTENSVATAVTNTAATAPSSTMRVEQPLVAAEINAAHELPESLHIGHAPNDRHSKAMASAVELDRESGIDRLERRPVDERDFASASDSTVPPSVVRPKHALRQSRQLIFLHDLKLVHPQELYANEPVMRLAEESVAARFADRSAQDSVRTETTTVSYTAFMDEALEQFAHNDHKACLDDLRFVLTQYPGDVNALFYAGLCSYNLGLYTHARTFLHRAATHPVDVFDEEAEWYHALTLERLGERTAASEAFARIAAGGGFYADRARTIGK